MARRHGKDTVVYINGLDLSGDSNSLDVIQALDAVETSGFQNRKQYTPGQIGATAEHKGWFDTDPEGLFETLKEFEGLEVVWCAAYGRGDGEWGWGGEGELVKTFQVEAPLSSAVSISDSLEFGLEFDRLRVLTGKSTVAVAGAAFDEIGAGSNEGIVGYLQVFEVLGGTPEFAIQHSATGTSAWTDKVAFAAVEDVGAQRVDAAGTVSRHLRVNVTNGSAIVFVGFNRRR